MTTLLYVRRRGRQEVLTWTGRTVLVRGPIALQVVARAKALEGRPVGLATYPATKTNHLTRYTSLLDILVQLEVQIDRIEGAPALPRLPQNVVA